MPDTTTRRWRASVNIKRHFELQPNNTVLLATELRNAVVQELMEIPEPIRNEHGNGCDTIAEKIAYLRNADDIRTVDDFDDWLADLYDICDTARVFLGV